MSDSLTGELESDISFNPLGMADSVYSLDATARAFPSILNVIYTTNKFRIENSKVYAAFLKSFNEVADFVDAHKEQAAEIYLEASKDKSAAKVAAPQDSEQSGYPLHDDATTQDGSGQAHVRDRAHQDPARGTNRHVLSETP